MNAYHRVIPHLGVGLFPLVVMITSQYKKEIQLSLKKVKGMVAKLEKMIAEDIYCADVAIQVSATIGLLRKVNTKLLKNHLMCCGKSKLTSPDSQQVHEFVDELAKVWDMTSRR